MKRVYAAVAVERGARDFGIALDSRPLRTPRRARVRLPTQALADAVADEWRAQKDNIRAETMPLTRLANIAHDGATGDPDAAVARLARYAETDLLCYRAADPPALARRQSALWQPVVEWAAARYGARARCCSRSRWRNGGSTPPA